MRRDGRARPFYTVSKGYIARGFDCLHFFEVHIAQDSCACTLRLQGMPLIWSDLGRFPRKTRFWRSVGLTEGVGRYQNRHRRIHLHHHDEDC